MDLRRQLVVALPAAIAQDREEDQAFHEHEDGDTDRKDEQVEVARGFALDGGRLRWEGRPQVEVGAGGDEEREGAERRQRPGAADPSLRCLTHGRGGPRAAGAALHRDASGGSSSHRSDSGDGGGAEARA